MPQPVFGLNVDPIDAILAHGEDAVLAVITGVEGPSYGPIGAMMAVFTDRHRVGTLSSGCIENDIALHALEALEKARPAAVRYGRGSPYMDIRLPCGGGLDILLLPRPDRRTLGQLAEQRRQRLPVTLRVARDGALSLDDEGETGWHETVFQVRFIPEIRFLVFGKGPEAGTFAALVQSAGYPNVLLSPDDQHERNSCISVLEVPMFKTPKLVVVATCYATIKFTRLGALAPLCFSTWPLISPSGNFWVCMFRYHLPACKSANC